MTSEAATLHDDGSKVFPIAISACAALGIHLTFNFIDRSTIGRYTVFAGRKALARFCGHDLAGAAPPAELLAIAVEKAQTLPRGDTVTVALTDMDLDHPHRRRKSSATPRA